MDSSALPRQVAEALDRGATILTANRRAARTLRHAFDRRALARGLPAWQPPPILSWDAWTGSLWHRLLIDGHATALLLNATQEHTLWREIVAAEPGTASARPLDALAETAANAWSLLHAWQAAPRLRGSAISTDTEAFEQWAQSFRQLCRAENLLTQAQLPEALRAATAAGHLQPSHAAAGAPDLLLVGFDSRTPAQTALLDALQASGLELDETAPATIEPRTVTTAPDPHDELAAAARWIRLRLVAQPTARLALIVPDIAAERAGIDRVLRAILAPELEEIAAPAATGPFEFSLGIPLAETPLVAAALDLLRLAAAPLPFERIGALLLSPHLAADPAESIARAEFDAFTFRRHTVLRPEFSLDALLHLASASRQAATIPTLLRHLRGVRGFLRQESLLAARSAADWSALFSSLLHSAGWTPTLPNATLGSAEFQVYRKFQSALDELSTLDFRGGRLSCAAALDALTRIAAQTLFAPESRNAPIQIMGPLESAGSHFDAVWFLRAGDLAWPTPVSPSPLLAWPLQRDLHLPGTHPEDEAALARRIATRIAASAPTVVFSYATESPEGRQRPSPALSHLGLDAVPLDSIAPPTPQPAAIAIESNEDIVPLPALPDRPVKGGATILQLQAACAFRAFAEIRLAATSLDTAGLGLDARERGSIVHAILDSLWSRLHTRDALRALARPVRDTLLAECIDHALIHALARSATPWDAAYLATERQRLLNLLRPWLDYEATRQPFTVAQREARLEDVRIGPLRLSVRVDRVDHTADGEEIILDYKTGAAEPAAWLTDRPDAPQLPLYAVLNDDRALAAVAFAIVRPGKDLGIAGYAAHAGVLINPARMAAPSLDTQREQWHTVLTALAAGFHSGEARVLPKHFPLTCKHCRQRLLCRLDLTALDADTLDEPDPHAVAEEEADV
jgi:ATP-dependent helicase/nuclease subunit B